MNGVTGLKPTSTKGIVPISRTLDSAGPITHDLTDALLIYSCMRDKLLLPIKPSKTEDMKLAVNTFNREQVSEAQLARYEMVFEALRCDGVRITEVLHAHSPYQRDVMCCERKKSLNFNMQTQNTVQ